MNTPNLGQNQMSIQEGFRQLARIMNAHFPAPPNQGYVGNRCGWYPEKPKRKRKSA